MKCQKCGASLPKDSMYCMNCGNEYKIVPDFEPEIENSIAKTMLGVGDDIEAEGKAADNAADSSASGQFKKKQKSSSTAHMITYGTLTCIVLVFIGIFLFHDSSAYLEMRAIKAEKESDYSLASYYYSKLRKKEPDNSKWYLQEAVLKNYKQLPYVPILI